MGKKQLKLFCYIIAAICIVNFISCSKSDSSSGSVIPPPNNPSCNTFTLISSTTTTLPCDDNPTGSIQITATGSNGFMFKLNSGGTFQQSNSFTNLTAGNYTVFVKDSAGCQQSIAVTVSATAPGPLFADVKSLLAASCTSCHNTANAPNVDGFDWTNQCSVIDQKLNIQTQVDNGSMPLNGPPLSSSQKAIIDNWVKAGGGYSN